MSERFPETPAGIRKAQEVAGPDGDWTQYVNWWSDVGSGVLSPDMIVQEAIKEGADVNPSAIGAVAIQDTGDVTAVPMVSYTGTEGTRDMPCKVEVPTGFRADLPA